jgi:hypothetical protein
MSEKDFSISVKEFREMFPDAGLEAVSDLALCPILHESLRLFSIAHCLNGEDWQVKNRIRNKQTLALLTWHGVAVVLQINFENVLRNRSGQKPLYAAKRIALYDFKSDQELTAENDEYLSECEVIDKIRDFIANKTWKELLEIGSEFFPDGRTKYVSKKIHQLYGIEDWHLG